jgi:hypothetical protein
MPGALPPGTHWAAVLSAAAAIASAMVLLTGALLAQRYALRVTAVVDAKCHTLPSGLLLHVRPTIRSAGFIRLELSRNDHPGPVVSVAEHRLPSSRDLSSGLLVGDAATQDAFTEDEVIDPGETISDSLYFLMPREVAATLGWRVHFTFRVSKRWPWHGAWDYVAATFVPTPADVEEP